jgi:tetratricopeptide (TPR) repeat protein
VAALWQRGERRRRVWTLATLAAVTAGFLVFRAVVPTPPHASPLYVATITGAASAVVDYLRVIALPFDLSIARPASDQPVLGWLAAAAVVALGVGARRRLGAAVVGGAAWALALLGTSLFAVASTHIIADRYLYAPMFGVGIALAEAARMAVAAAATRPVLRWPLRVAAVVWAAMLCAVGWRQVPFWQDRRALYEHTAELVPDSSLTQYRVAFLDIEDGRWDLALPRLERAIELDPSNAEALNNLGVYHLRAGDLAAAEALLARAVAANPGHFRSFLNLGLTRLMLGRVADGCKDIKRAREIMPTYEAARLAFEDRCVWRRDRGP